MLATLKTPYEFDWDPNNIDKNWTKHGVHWQECESIFDSKIFVVDDNVHSIYEKRFTVLGITHQGRFLYVTITIRNNKIRVISARDQSKKNRKIYFDEVQR